MTEVKRQAGETEPQASRAPLATKRVVPWSTKEMLIACLLSACAAWFGLGFSRERVIEPASSEGMFTQIAADGWVEHGARISLTHLLPFANRLILSFDAWRPAGLEPARIAVRVCGELRSTFVVTREQPVHMVPLRGACEPREITFEVLNPFVPSARDRRQAGARLVEARVTSRIGLPLRSTRVVAPIAALILITSLLYVWSMRRAEALRRLAPHFLWIVPLAGALLLTRADGNSMQKLFGLWLLASSVGVGVLIGSFIPRALWTRVSTREGAVKPTSEQPESVVAGGSSGWSWSLAITAIVLGGGALRFWGLGFGLPNNYHPDEVPKINAIMRMVESGTLDPQYFLHPSLLLYSSYFVNSVIHWLGIPVAEWLQIPGDFRSTQFFAGRIVSALAGTASLFLLYRIGLRLFSREVGLIGAALLAVFPLHVTCSRYMKEDALLTFMLLLTVSVLLKAVQENKRSWLIAAGLLAGATAASKYSGLLAVGLVATAPWLRSRSWRPDMSWAPVTALACVVFPLGFLLCTPYAILNSETFIKDFQSERNHMLRGHTIPIDAWSQFWMYHFWRSIIPGASTIATLVGIIGMGILLWRRRIEDLFVVGLILLFYMPAEWVKAKPEPQPERYIFPCLPFLALAAGECVRMLRVTPLRALAPLLLIGIIAAPLVRSVQLASEVPDDTRDQMARWMIENLPPGSKVYLDWKPYAPRFWNGEFEVTHIPRARILEKLAVEDLKASGQDYLVLSSLFYDRYFVQPLAARVFQDHLRLVFEHVPIVTHIEPRFGTYGFNNPRLTLFSLKPEDFARLEGELAQKRAGSLTATTNEVRAQFAWDKEHRESLRR